MGSVVTEDVWIDEGHGRIGIVDPSIAGMASVSVSCNDGRVIGVWLDRDYHPLSTNAVAVPPAYELEPGQRIFFRAETTRVDTAPVNVPIRQLDDAQVTRTFVALTVLPDGVDDPPERPQPKTRPAPNEPPPTAPPRARRWAPSHRDGWEYAGVIGVVLHAYNFDDGRIADEPRDIYYLAKAALVAADLVQYALEGHVDRTKYCHTRARGVVHAVIEHHQPPVGSDATITRGWIVGVALQTVQLCRIADALCTETPR